jgi:hypothetical protein
MCASCGDHLPPPISCTKNGTMPLDQTRVPSVDAADALFRQAVMSTFRTIMRSTDLSPIAVINLAASAVGALYCEVSYRHEGEDGCSCGWQPQQQKDIEALQLALAAAAQSSPVAGLLLADAAGRA